MIEKKPENPKLKLPNKETLLYVGDSVAHTTDFKYLQRKTKIEIRHVKAYSANLVLGEEKSFWPEKNVQDIVEKEMKKENDDYLVIGHSTVDITNLDVEDVSEKHLEHNKHIVLDSAHSIFNTATKVLETHKTVKKIILLKPTPRFDSRLKAHLTQLVSNTYEEMRESSMYKDKINLGEHSINFENQYLHYEIYGNPGWMNYDGFHLRGCQGRIEMTQSLLTIFTDAGLSVGKGSGRSGKVGSSESVESDGSDNSGSNISGFGGSDESERNGSGKSEGDENKNGCGESGGQYERQNRSVENGGSGSGRRRSS